MLIHKTHRVFLPIPTVGKKKFVPRPVFQYIPTNSAPCEVRKLNCDLHYWLSVKHSTDQIVFTHFIQLFLGCEISVFCKIFEGKKLRFIG